MSENNINAEQTYITPSLRPTFFHLTLARLQGELLANIFLCFEIVTAFRLIYKINNSRTTLVSEKF